jgi:ubiquinone/menaquinone biosynthesis C-methylase UbiE
MNFRSQDYYVRPDRRRVVPGSIFLNVPVLFLAGQRLPSVSIAPDGTLHHQDVAAAWTSAPRPRRDEGLPVLVRAKARPVLVLRIGAAMTDRTHQQSVWAAPLYGVQDPPRRGPNIFPLPARPEAGLRFEGFADLYQATLVPLPLLREATYACDLSPAALTLLLGAVATWAEGDPPSPPRPSCVERRCLMNGEPPTETTGGAATLGQFALGVEGLALLRHWLIGDPDAVRTRLEEVRALAGRLDEPPLSVPVVGPEAETLGGYAQWAATYDGPNPAVAREERTVWPLLDAVPVDRALDAACGTGRHARYLADRGHAVVGVDASPEMLSLARARVPEGYFRLGRLEALPVDDASVDLAVCALALTHCPSLLEPIQELARVVRPGGRLILSDIHPVVIWLGGHAIYRDAGGNRAFMRNHAHPHSTYFDAFAAAGLDVARCLEPPIAAADLTPLTETVRAAALEAFVGLPGTLVWELRRP